jgi:hypothetical protein
MKRKLFFVIVFGLMLSLLLVGVAQAEGAGCYAVSGEIDQLLGPTGTIYATISGDLEGTFAAFGGPQVFHGAVMTRPVEQTWEISGGIIESLIGETLVFDVDFIGIFAKPGLLSINNTARIVEGAQKGNLTQHGWTELVGPPWLNHLDYYGVICP